MMLSQRVVVILEDQLAKGTNKPGPTALLEACVADRIAAAGGPWVPFSLKDHLDIQYKKGNGNLLTTCKTKFELLSGSGVVLAVLDRDKAPKLLSLQGKSCLTLLRQAFFEQCAPAIELVFLDRNIETVVEGVCDLLGVEPELRERAVRNKDHNARDQVLHRISQQPGQQALRTTLQTTVPSFGRLVTHLCGHLGLP